MRSPGLSALIADAAFLAHEAQTHLLETYGEHEGWNVDLVAGTFTFAGEQPATFGVQLLGSAAPGPQSWLWGWANPTGFSDAVLDSANRTRALGEQYRIPELTSAELPFGDEDYGQGPGMALAYDLSLAARVASGRWFAYSGEVGGGTRVWMLLDGLRLPAPSALRTVRVLSEALTTTSIADQRRAVASYATLRGVAWDGTTLRMPDGDIAVTFDDSGRISGLDGGLRPA